MRGKSLDKDRRAALASQNSDPAAVMAALSSDHSLGPNPGPSETKTSSLGTSGNTLHSGNALSSNNPSSNSESKRSWQSLYHVNGVAVYAEDEGEHGGGGAVMASVVVRASPCA